MKTKWHSKPFHPSAAARKSSELWLTKRMACSWVDEGRISVAATVSHRETELKLYRQLLALSKNVATASDTANKLADASRRHEAAMKELECHSNAEIDVQEDEVTDAVADWLAVEGYEVLKVPLKEVYNEQGHLVTDLDGFLSVSKGRRTGLWC